MHVQRHQSGAPRAEAAGALITLHNIDKDYATPAGVFPALRGVSLEIQAGELIALTGRSGSGKSTLLNLIGGLDRPSGGELSVGGLDIHAMSENELARWRGKSVGVVFQFFQLLPTLTVIENVMLPMDFDKVVAPGNRRPRALQLLEQTGIAEQADKLPATLSGGQQQRAALARALANNPPIVIADEPTGNLDSETSRAVLTLFRSLADAGTTVIIATHERDIADVIDRSIMLEDGKIREGLDGEASQTMSKGLA